MTSERDIASPAWAYSGLRFYLEAMREALVNEAHVLVEHPLSIVQQLHNRLIAEPACSLLAALAATTLADAERPWFRAAAPKPGAGTGSTETVLSTSGDFACLSPRPGRTHVAVRVDRPDRYSTAMGGRGTRLRKEWTHHRSDVCLWDYAAPCCLWSLPRVDGHVSEIVWLDEGRELLLGCEDGRLQVWDVANQSLAREVRLEGHKLRCLTSGSVSGLLYVLLSDAHQFVDVLSHGRPPSPCWLAMVDHALHVRTVVPLPAGPWFRIAHGAAGEVLVTGRERVVAVDGATGTPRASLDSRALGELAPLRELERNLGESWDKSLLRNVCAIASSPENGVFAVGDDWGSVCVAETATLRPVWFAPSEKTWRLCKSFDAGVAGMQVAHSLEVACIALTDDARLIGSGSGNPESEGVPGTLCVWETSSGRRLSVRSFPSGANSAAFIADGRSLALGGRDRLSIEHAVADVVTEDAMADVVAEQQAPTRPQADDSLDALVKVSAFTREGKWRAHAVWGDLFVTLRTRGDESLRVFAHPGEIISLDWGESPPCVASCGEDGSCRLWGIDGSLLRTFSAPEVRLTRACFSPGNQWLAVGGMWGLVAVFDPADSLVKGLAVAGLGDVSCLAFSPDGLYLLASGESGVTVVHRTDAWEPVSRPSPHRGEVTAACFAEDGRVVTGGLDGVVKISDPVSGVLLRAFSAHRGPVRGVLAHPDLDGLILTYGDDHTCKLWSEDSESALACYVEDAWFAGVAACPDDGTLILFDCRGKERVFSLTALVLERKEHGSVAPTGE